MTTTVQFPQAKDPADVAWHVITLLGVTLSDTVPVIEIVADGVADVDVGPGIYPTPGDGLPGGMLTETNAQIVHAPAGDGVAMLLAGGVPGQTYAVRAKVVTLDGATLFRTAILTVTGL